MRLLKRKRCDISGPVRLNSASLSVRRMVVARKGETVVVRSSWGSRSRESTVTARIRRRRVAESHTESRSEIEPDGRGGSFDLAWESFTFPPDLDLLAAIEPAVHPRDGVGRLTNGFESDRGGPSQCVIVHGVTGRFR